MLVIVILSVRRIVTIDGSWLVELVVVKGSSSSTLGEVGMVHAEARLPIIILDVLRLIVLV